MNKLYQFFGGRKLFFAILLFGTAVFFVVTDRTTSAEWMDYTKWIFGVYAAGNVGERVTKSFGKNQ